MKTLCEDEKADVWPSRARRKRDDNRLLRVMIGCLSFLLAMLSSR